MQHLTWLTDLHFDFLEMNEVEHFIQQIAAMTSDGVLIGGDIGNAMSVKTYLTLFDRILKCPVYFVLGNHDFYGDSIENVCWSVKNFLAQSNRLQWLTVSGIVPLTPHTGLIGHESWGDGRLGHAIHSQVWLNDFIHIKELTGLLPKARFLKLNALGDEAAQYFQAILPQAVNRYPQLILLTHVPPFKAACWHQGKISNDEYLPHFTCSAVGDVLVQVMQAHPACHLTVLCGHTHSAGETDILPNLHVKTGGAEYGKPELQKLITVL